MKVVINAAYGGFMLTDAMLAQLSTLKGVALENVLDPLPRWDVDLVKVVETALAAEPQDIDTDLRIVEVPAGVKFFIDEYDGWESIQRMDEIDWHTAT